MTRAERFLAEVSERPSFDASCLESLTRARLTDTGSVLVEVTAHNTVFGALQQRVDIPASAVEGFARWLEETFLKQVDTGE